MERCLIFRMFTVEVGSSDHQVKDPNSFQVTAMVVLGPDAHNKIWLCGLLWIGYDLHKNFTEITLISVKSTL